MEATLHFSRGVVAGGGGGMVVVVVVVGYPKEKIMPAEVRVAIQNCHSGYLCLLLSLVVAHVHCCSTFAAYFCLYSFWMVAFSCIPP